MPTSSSLDCEQQARRPEEGQQQRPAHYTERLYGLSPFRLLGGSGRPDGNSNNNKTLAVSAPPLKALQPRKETEEAWILLWQDVSKGREVRADDKAALLACERWRRKRLGERSGLWHRISASLLLWRAHTDWDRLTACIRGGVPDALRGQVWYACSGAVCKRSNCRTAYPDYVAQGLHLKNEATKNIEHDLPRSGAEESQIQDLREILCAFAVRNPQIGYCQSMNFIAKAMLSHNDAEHSFWILCSLLEDVLPAGYYTPSMNGLRADLRLLDSLIERFLPKLRKHLDAHQIELSPIVMNWFLCLFVNSLPETHSKHFLDCLFHEGGKLILRASLAILALHEDELLKCAAVVDAYSILRTPFSSNSPQQGLGPRPILSGDLVSGMYGKWLSGLSTDSIDELRARHLRAVAAEDEKRASPTTPSATE